MAWWSASTAESAMYWPRSLRQSGEPGASAQTLCVSVQSTSTAESAGAHRAQLVWDDMDQAASQIITTDADAKIVSDMWEDAREEVRNNYPRELAQARANPESEFCDTMEEGAIGATGK